MEFLGRYCTVLFNTFCFIILGYALGLQFEKYLRNEDVSTISFKSFGANEYPTYTVCLEDNFDGDLFKYETLDSKQFSVNDNNQLVKKGTERRENLNSKMAKEKTTARHPPINMDKGTNKKDLMTSKPDAQGQPLLPNAVIQTMKETPAPEVFIVKEKNEENIVCMSSNNGFGRGDAINLNNKLLIYPLHLKGLLMGNVPETMSYSLPKGCIGSYSQNITYRTSEVSAIEYDNLTVDVQEYVMDFSADIIGENKQIGWIDNEYRNSHKMDEVPLWDAKYDLYRQRKAFLEKVQLRTDHPYPFRISYQEPKRICFGPKVNTSIIKQHEYVTLDLDKLSGKMNEGKKESNLKYLRVYIHKQGQFIRAIGRDVASYASPDLIYDVEYGSKISFFVSQVTLLRNRRNANSPCDGTLKDEDMMIMKSIVKESGCVPSYWKSLVPKDPGYPTCNTSTQYALAYGYVSNLTRSRELFTPPCEHMTVVSYIQKEKGRKRDEMDKPLYVDLQFIQGSELYQEIKNVREFNLKDCWSGIGGFVGMIVGYSLMHLPELFSGHLIWVQKKSVSVFSTFFGSG